MNCPLAFLECGRCSLVEILRDNDSVHELGSVIICSRCATFVSALGEDTALNAALPTGLFEDELENEQQHGKSYAAAVRSAASA
jgi:hypothetical protein